MTFDRMFFQRTARLLALGFSVLLASACSTVVQLSSLDSNAQAVSNAAALQGYARVLQRHVNDRGEVDFAALRDDTSNAGWPALTQYLRAVANTPIARPAAGAPRGRSDLAHMINAYNALSMYNVIASGIPQTHAGLAKLRFFVLRKFEIGGEVMSLYAFENDIIRKLDEPRSHFALNCSAVSCPVLPRAPFTAANLDAELQRETKAFFARPENLAVDNATQTVYLNELLKFYTEDFVPGHAESLIAYAQRYTEQTIPPHYKVLFTPYDWTVANSVVLGKDGRSTRP